MTRPKKITAQDVYNYTKCRYRVYLDSNGDRKEKGEAGPFVKLLWENGLLKEKEYILTLSKERVEDLSMYLPDAAFEKTIESMKAGRELIYQGCLQVDTFLGRPDLLLKHADGSSKFGAYYYEPIDIKAGRGWEEKDGARIKFKEHYAFQLMFYRMVLKTIQGCLPEEARIINVNKEPESFNPGEFELGFETALAEVTDLVQGRKTSEPALGGGCAQCEWHGHCHKWARENNDPTLIFYVGRQAKLKLKEAGLRTVNDIAGMDITKYLKGKYKIPGVGETTLSKMQKRACVILSGRPEIRAGYSFPDAGNEIYFDIEDDPTRGITYLFGLLIKKGGREDYRCFLAKKPEDEEKAVITFWDFIRKTDDAVYYVYSAKERSTLKHLMERYNLDGEIFNKYVGSEFDLYSDLVFRYSDWPVYSYGLKHIAAQIGFKWRDPDPSGANSIVWYNDYLANPGDEGKIQRIIDYNEDDCRAMVVLTDYFRKAQHQR
ncbi:MAG: TM0106 family RecB-like putative nuclease [Planctomycetes bacterium]|nr:TM0106 family RecB-like putative nuclease [Planctomycetota bacterium]